MNKNEIRQLIGNNFEAIVRCGRFANRVTCFGQNSGEFFAVRWFSRDYNSGLVQAWHLRLFRLNLGMTAGQYD
jgi:hypothetical protein